MADGVAQGLALAQGGQAPQTAATGDGGEVAAADVDAATAGVSTRLVDLFCGAGLFGVSLAATGRFASVLGLELGPDSVRSAGVNAQANGVGTLCRFQLVPLAPRRCLTARLRRDVLLKLVLANPLTRWLACGPRESEQCPCRRLR